MADPKPDYYDILHVSADAPEAVITASYRTLMQKLRMHPDLGGDAETAALINEAYAVLGDASRRADYDAARAARAGTGPVDHPESDALRPPDPFRECVFCRSAHQYGRRILLDARCGVCKSPLAPAEPQRFETEDKRAIARINNRMDVQFFTRWPQASAYRGRTEDISLSGLRIVSAEALSPGQFIKLNCPILDAVALVRNHRAERRGFSIEHASGLSFVTLSISQSRGGFVSARA